MRVNIRVLLSPLLLAAAAVAAAAAAASAVSASAPAPNLPVPVFLTVRTDRTIFARRVRTRGHTVTTASGGTHVCDGTNNGANPAPGGTVTSALDDSGLRWDGTWFDSFQDYFITTVKDVEATGNTFWKLSVNGEELQVGGCQYRVKPGDRIEIELDTFEA